MLKLKSLGDAIDFAISKEKEAETLYSDAADRMKNKKAYAGEITFAEKMAARMFMTFSDKEGRHAEKLKDIKASIPSDKLNRQFEEPFVFEDPSGSSDLDLGDESDFDALVRFASKMEVISFKMYTFLAKETDDDRYREMNSFFKELAAEEAGHNMRISMGLD